MTISTTTSRISYTGDGVTTAFAVPFKFLVSTDLVVYFGSVLQGAGYTVTGAGSATGGTVTFAAAPAAAVQVLILRNQPNTQNTIIPPSGPFPAVTVETMADKAMIGIQQLADAISRALVVVVNDNTVLNALPAVASRLDRVLAFNATTGQPEMSAFTATQIASVIAAIYAAAAGPLDALSFLQLGAGAVSRTGQDKARDFVSVLDFIPVAQYAAIRAGTSTYDCYANIMQAINSVTYIGTFIGSSNRAGPSIYFPPGLYNVSAGIELKKRVTLWGDGSGMAYGDAAILKWTNDTYGILISSNASSGQFAVDAAGYAGGVGGSASVIKGLALVRSVYGTNLNGHAIHMRTRALIENVYIEAFSGDGIRIYASVGGGGAEEGNANNWAIRGGRVNDCGGNGLFVYGGDANAGTCIGLDCSHNGLGATGGWGILESSFLGNSYVGTHTSANVSGGYKTTNANSRNTFYGAYDEGGQPANLLLYPAKYISGTSGSGFNAASTAQFFNDQGFLATFGTAGSPSISFSGDTDTGLYSAQANVMGFAAGGGNRGRLGNSAKFSTNGIYFNSAVDSHEFVQNSATLSVSTDYMTSAAYTGLGKLVKADTASGTGFNLLTLANLGANCFQVLGNGNAQNTNNSYGAISDLKLKDNIAEAPSYWEKLKAFRWVNYTLKDDDTQQRMLGLVAQEAEKVSPGVVYETPDRDADGELTGTYTKAVKYSVVAMQQAVVLQEAMRRIEELEAKVVALESRA